MRGDRHGDGRGRSGLAGGAGVAAVLTASLLLLPPASPGSPGTPSAAPSAGREVPWRLPADEVVALRRDVRGILADAARRRGRWSALAVSLDRGDTLFAVNADSALVPASNQKLVTTAAALHYLGPDFRYGTYVVADAPVDSGVVRGDVVLYGTGDPTLSDRFYPERGTVFERLADELRSAGIRRIEGDVVGDASYFPGSTSPAGWPREGVAGRSAADWFAAPATALAFNENVVTLHIGPGPRAGTPPRVQATPGEGRLAVVNDATTGGRDRRARLAVRRADADAPIRISGTIPPGHRGVWRRVTIPDPPLFAASTFRAVLEDRGIEVGGDIRSTRHPEASLLSGRRVFAPAFRREPRILARHASPPLSRILTVVNRESHNHFAETVLRTLGRTVLGDGSPAGGVAAVRRFLVTEVGLGPGRVRPVDGSGLSPENRASAADLVALLAYMEASPDGETFRATLPEAGSRRGLGRMYRTRAAGNLRAKTGTLDEVSALSGYVRTADGERVAFSLVGNGLPSTWRAKRTEDRIGVRLASFRRADGRPVTSARERTGGIRHRVQPGENLTLIARRYGVSVGALRRANPGIELDVIHPGEELRIP